MDFYESWRRYSRRPEGEYPQLSFPLISSSITIKLTFVVLSETSQQHFHSRKINPPPTQDVVKNEL